VQAVAGADLSLAAGECLGIVGESGSGKSQLLQAILGLSPEQALVGGDILYRGRQLLGMPGHELNRIRGRRIAMIFQDPMTALNPCLRVGTQIEEVARWHLRATRREAQRRALELLAALHISDPERFLRRYPHELSGGMRQRAMIAMALIGEPEVLLADEPTTALDVTVQAQILRVLAQIRERTGIAIMLVTHDMGVVAEIADRVTVMYAGRVVESGTVHALFDDPRHPYTEALQACVPRPDRPAPRRLVSIGGAPPDPAALPAGCAFAPRCAYRLDVCHAVVPELLPRSEEHVAACHYEGPLDKLRVLIAE
jgi:oligopeptide/dipeptide ABC transporter ATP-binding protein